MCSYIEIIIAITTAKYIAVWFSDDVNLPNVQSYAYLLKIDKLNLVLAQ
jgi:hypothetical protein